MSRRAQENLIALIVLGVFIVAIVIALDYGQRARMVPLPIAVLGVILTLWQLVWQNIRPADELHVDLLEVLTRREGEAVARNVSSAFDEQSAHQRRQAAGRESVACGMVVLLLGLVWVIGLLPGVFLFMLGYFLLSDHYSLQKALSYSLGLVVTLYLLFVQGLGIALYHGWLEEWIRSL
ncbi:MAG: tripartite tricarboxylate transporter TctB family protein [Burkholderiales bacterium]|nr:tripartite tricarboxylate transporter TctB family protein [Burkholderiales bacterium]MDP3714986.1 tripartite tricarboxylate transporter TctB family protein [Burkholderiales bacterium]